MYCKMMYKHNYILYIIKSIIIKMQHPALKELISYKKGKQYTMHQNEKTLYITNELNPFGG